MKNITACLLKCLILFSFVTAWLFLSIPLHAQENKEKQTPYYIDVNKADKTTIQEIHNGLLHLKYHDAFGNDKEAVLVVFNWKIEKVATYQLEKAFGLNYFTINIESLLHDTREGDVLICKMKDEGGHQYEFLIKKVAPPKIEDPIVSIFVNPLQVDCELMMGNYVEFYGKIEGGKAPYKTNWYILNEKRNDFLYQPRSEVIEQPGKTMVIQVDKDPDYYVLLHVKDACGNEVEQMVYLVCRKSEKKINTIFIEPINNPSKNKERENFK